MGIALAGFFLLLRVTEAVFLSGVMSFLPTVTHGNRPPASTPALQPHKKPTIRPSKSRNIDGEDPKAQRNHPEAKDRQEA